MDKEEDQRNGKSDQYHYILQIQFFQVITSLE
jgi:hypothetical protein